MTAQILRRSATAARAFGYSSNLRPAEHKLQDTGSPVGSLLGEGSKKAQNQDLGGKRGDGADQADGIDCKPMPLPTIIRVFRASDLDTTRQISDVHQRFPLIYNPALAKDIADLIVERYAPALLELQISMQVRATQR